MKKRWKTSIQYLDRRILLYNVVEFLGNQHRKEESDSESYLKLLYNNKQRLMSTFQSVGSFNIIYTKL